MHLYVIRHAQPLDESKSGGQGDPPLSELGHAQAKAIGEFLTGEGIEHIVASPMVRAHQTAEPLAAALGLDIELDDDLKEAGWQLGAYMRTEENLDHFITKLAEDPEFLFRPEGREAFAARVIGSFTRIAEENSGRRVAVFCHGMVTTTLVSTVLGIVPSPDQLHPDYSSLTRVQASPSRDRWSLLSFNEAMHLAEVQAQSTAV